MCVTAASGGPLLFAQYAPSAILKPKNRKTWQGDFLSLARNFRGCVMQGRKTAKGSKNRIEHISHHFHQVRKTVTGLYQSNLIEYWGPRLPGVCVYGAPFPREWIVPLRPHQTTASYRCRNPSIDENRNPAAASSAFGCRIDKVHDCSSPPSASS
jgi:hypothetical protein